MNYFQVLGTVFGLAAMLKPVYMHVLPWDEKAFLAKTYDRQRPAWIVPVAVVGLAWVALTWYLHLTAGVPHSWVVTVLFSLTALKAIALLFDYGRFQRWVAGLLAKDRGRGVVMVDLAVGALGLAIVVASFVLY